MFKHSLGTARWCGENGSAQQCGAEAEVQRAQVQCGTAQCGADTQEQCGAEAQVQRGAVPAPTQGFPVGFPSTAAAASTTTPIMI